MTDMTCPWYMFKVDVFGPEKDGDQELLQRFFYRLVDLMSEDEFDGLELGASGAPVLTGDSPQQGIRAHCHHIRYCPR